MKSIRNQAVATAILIYLLIVLGAVVRITGSGMGCGDDWPLCNGYLIPPLSEIETLIEWAHRLVAALVSVMVAALALVAFLRREGPGVSGPGGPLRPALLAVLLLIVQVLLGAVTVRLELPPWSVILHLGTALALLATVVITALRSGVQRPLEAPGGLRRGAWAAVWLTAATLLLGGVTANMEAGTACSGFPLCNGRLWPTEPMGGLNHIHWTHRLLAYGLLLHLAGLAVRGWKGGSSRYLGFAGAALGLATVQAVAGAVMVLGSLQAEWRAIHAAIGVALWSLTVAWSYSFGRPAPRRSPTGSRIEVATRPAVGGHGREL